MNADDAAIARDNAALTAGILAHNAAVAAGGGSNAEAAALAVRQAAFGETAGIAVLQDVLPINSLLKDVIAVLPDGTVTVLRGVSIPELLLMAI